MGTCGGMYVHKCTTYETTDINHVTRNTDHILYKLHFILLFISWTNMAAILHIQLTLLSSCMGIKTWKWWTYAKPHAHTHKMQYLLHIILAYICQKQVWPPNCMYAIHAKYLMCILWGMYVHICATYEVACVNQTTRNAILRWHHHWWCQKHRRSPSDCIGCIWPLDLLYYRDRSSCIWQDRTKPYTINEYHNLLYSWDMQMQWFLYFL